MINNFDDLIMGLDDIDLYVNSILYYYCPLFVKQELDFKEILMYLSCLPEII